MTLGMEQGVIDLCKNTDSNLINRMLIKARARLDKILAKDGLTAPSSDTDLDTAVEAIAAKLIATGPGAVDPRTNFKVDGFERKEALASQLDDFQAIADERISDYVLANTEGDGLPTMLVIGRMGSRIGEYEEMTEDQEAEY